jgi:hypothetical protein
MPKRSTHRRARVYCAAITLFCLLGARARADVTASNSLTIMASGPRAGSAGSVFFNVQGKNKGRFADFGILVFPVQAADVQADFDTLAIELVQSVPGFANGGKVDFYFATPAEEDAAHLQKLRFQSDNQSGLAKDAFKSLHRLGAGIFKKTESGHIDTFRFKIDESLKDTLRKRVKGGRAIHIVIAPADDDVAATYFGAGNETGSNRPRIRFGGT